MIPEVIIFDVDGTLAETEEIHRRAFNETFSHFDLDWHWTQDDYRALLKVTGGRERIRHFVTGMGTGADYSDEMVGTMHAHKTKQYVALLSSGSFTLRPGIERLIEDARASHCRLAIATTTSRDNVDCLVTGALGPSGLSMFEAIVCGEDVRMKKPAPDVYLHVLRQLDVSSEKCIAIEDSRNGLLSAHAAGIRVAITPAFYTGHEDFSDADWIFRDGPALAALAT